jgi:hypothetical protein
MSKQDAEIEWLKASVNCTALLERLPAAGLAARPAGKHAPQPELCVSGSGDLAVLHKSCGDPYMTR